jgi:antitoxin component YwqK of YwqJK toxin-antitoxin module
MRKTLPALLFTIIVSSSCVRQSYENEVIEEKYIHPYGLTVPRSHWEEAGQCGKVVQTLRDDIICTQSYEGGLLNGETTYTFPGSNIVEKRELYSQGHLVKVVFYYMSGKPQQEIAEDPSKVLAITHWYEDGRIKSYEKQSAGLLTYGEYYDRQGRRISSIEAGYGEKITQDPHGLLLFKDTFKNALLESRTVYYSNGTPKEIIPYRNGVVEGLKKTYYPGGEPKTFETWSGGKQEGVTMVFAEGQKEREISYVDGRKNGISKLFENGEIVIEEQTWKDDVLHGPSFTKVDNRSVTEWYYKGNKVTKGYYDSFVQFTPVN